MRARVLHSSSSWLSGSTGKTDWLTFLGLTIDSLLVVLLWPSRRATVPRLAIYSGIHVAVAGPGKVVVVHRWWRWWLLLTRRRCRQVRFVFSFQRDSFTTPAPHQRSSRGSSVRSRAVAQPYTHIILYPLNGFSQRTTAAGDEPARSHIQGGIGSVYKALLVWSMYGYVDLGWPGRKEERGREFRGIWNWL